MDIPAVLATINDGEFRNIYWGPCANSSNTYEELSAKWPKSNPKLPTKQEMQNHWDSLDKNNLDAILNANININLGIGLGS